MEIVSFNHYSGFFRRLLAVIIDHFIIGFLAGLLGFFLHFRLYGEDHFSGYPIIGIGFFTLLYYVILESSEWQATVGKKLLNMKVTDENFARISPLKALVRYLASWLSGAILLLGYIWVIFDSKKQAWHDKIAGTYVINID
ncbi:MAG: RDD family protein [Bacteroidetes bacterium]|nr:RDD family protein [Bacteroidota bacterium]